MGLQELQDLHELAKQDARTYTRKRALFSQLVPTGSRHFLGIIGPRGAGKTILLRQYALENEKAFYLSADTLQDGDDLWEVVRELKDHLGYDTLLLDEIHFLPDPNAFLKKIYDFLDLRVFFTSSVALAMHESAHDLSRRVRLAELKTFSFREYLDIVRGISLPALNLEEILAGDWSPEHLRAGRHFDTYLKGGILPFAMDEPEPLPLLEGIVAKVITGDLPAVASLLVEELDAIKRLLRFVGRSQVDGINYSSLSRNLGITKYKAEQYTELLERAYILQQVFPAGTNVTREPKVLMAPPYRLLYCDYEDAVGGLREDFCTDALLRSGWDFDYLKSTRGAKTPDYLIKGLGEKLAIEIGGPGKGRRQFKGVNVDRKVVFSHDLTPRGGRLPLFMLGFLGEKETGP